MVSTEKKKLSWEITLEREEILKRLIDRICTLPSQENNLVGAGAIRAELWRFLERADSADHATRTVDALMEPQEGKAPWRPTGLQVRDMLNGTPTLPPPAMKPADPNCRACHGYGVVYVTRGGIDYAGDCECRKVPA